MVRNRPARWTARRRRARIACSLAAAIALPAAHAAAYLPGALPDPPTGEPAPASADAAEPLRGTGIEWRFAPWRTSGSLALDARWYRDGDSGRASQFALAGDIEAASYLWQPWFAQVRLGLGFVASRDSSSGDADAETAVGTGLTGRAQLSVFPSSRFPFEARAEVADTRASGDSPLGRELRSHRVALSQQYRPAGRNDSYQLTLDVSHLFTELERDSLVTASGSALLLRDAHSFEFNATASDNHNGDASLRSRLATLSARHGWRRNGDASVESLASWTQSRLGIEGPAGFDDSGVEVRQISSIASWRPREGEATHWAGHGLQWVGSARVVEVRPVGAGDDADPSRAFNATLGATADLSSAWRAGASVALNRFEPPGSAPSQSAGVAASLSWSPRLAPWGEWRYVPSASASVGATRGSALERESIGLQGVHALTRDVPLGATDRLSLSLSQSASLAVERNGDAVDAFDDGRSRTRALSHSAALYWQGYGEGASQRFASVSLNDARSWSEQGDTDFQLVNLQWTQRTQLSRHASWSANLTVQATRSGGTLRLPNLADGSDGTAQTLDTGWLTFANGSVSHENARWLGIPRLRLTLLASIHTQQVSSRASGDADAPLERVGRSLEARVDYAIGRLETRLAARAAKLDERSVLSLQARVMRRF